MKRRLLQLCLFIVFGATCRTFYGQALATATGPGSFVAAGGGISAFQASYGHQDIAGGFGFVDVNPSWRWGFEGEARFLHWHAQEGIRESMYLGGVRVGLWPKPKRWLPYGKFLAGAGEITLPFGYAHGGFLAYAPGAGLDLSLTDRLTLRAIDVEYQRWPQFPYGSLNPYGVSTGMSFRFNKISRYPRSTARRN